MVTQKKNLGAKWTKGFVFFWGVGQVQKSPYFEEKNIFRQ